MGQDLFEIIQNCSPSKFGGHLASKDAFSLASKEKKDAQEVAQEMAKELAETNKQYVTKAEAVAGFVNITLSEEGLAELLERSIPLQNDQWTGQTVVVDYSGPNVGKPFSVGHLRSTVIGDAVANMHQASGAKVIRVNHLGDLGTQFGKLIVALTKWGDEKTVAKKPTAELLKLYVKFHDEAESNEKLNDEARAWYKKLEDQNPDALKIWQKIVDWSLVEYHKTYELLRINFESEEVPESGVMGESFYTKEMMMQVMAELESFGLVKESEGAKILDLGEEIPPTILIKKDGATVYLLRDLAALKYRLTEWRANKIIYHIGTEQSLHLQQLFITAKRIGWLGEGAQLMAAHHGQYRLKEGKMSTRKGRGVQLKELITKGIEKTAKLVKDSAKAQSIAVSAIKYNDLSHNRVQDVMFEWGKALNLEGNSAPYLIYTNARAHGVFRTSEYGQMTSFSLEAKKATPLLKEKKEEELILAIFHCRQIFTTATTNAEPNLLAEQLYTIARQFNSYYGAFKINTDNQELRDARLFLVKAVSEILEEGLTYLGIETFTEL